MMADQILQAVEKWAAGYKMIRETIAAADVDGRMDALLVPYSWEAESYRKVHFKQGIIGIEVKTNKYDFKRGLQEKQFEKYADSECISGLYIATGFEVCKTIEIPKRFGHLICNVRMDERQSMLTCVCRRNPQWKEAKLNQETMWRILWATLAAMNREMETRQQTIERTKKTCNQIFGRLLNKIHNEVENAK